MPDRKRTVVQHSGWGYGEDPQFRQALETREVPTKRVEESILKAGGGLVDTYGQAEAYAEEENYQPDNAGIVPRAPGTFGTLKVDNLAIYIPAQDKATLTIRYDSTLITPQFIAEHVGELVVRGHNVMKGYRNNPEATAEALRDGWLHTGDLGYEDEDGYLFIVDRLKDLVIRGGYNVYPREIEEVLYAHPDISEAAVIGRPDDRLGEEIVAVIVTFDAALTSSRPVPAKRYSALLRKS